MTRQWIDFKKLREQLDFAAVLDFYKVELRRKGRDQFTGFCPLPSATGRSPIDSTPKTSRRRSAAP